SIAEEDFGDLMRSDAWAGNARMIGQDDDRALSVEKTNDVVVVGDEAAPVRDVAQTRKDIREPAEAIANWCAVVGRSGGKGLLQHDFWDEPFGIQSLIPKKQIIERGEQAAVACCQQRIIPAQELTLFIPIALRQLVTRRTGCIVDDGMLHAERIENV